MIAASPCRSPATARRSSGASSAAARGRGGCALHGDRARVEDGARGRTSASWPSGGRRPRGGRPRGAGGGRRGGRHRRRRGRESRRERRRRGRARARREAARVPRGSGGTGAAPARARARRAGRRRRLADLPQHDLEATDLDAGGRGHRPLDASSRVRRVVGVREDRAEAEVHVADQLAESLGELHVRPDGAVEQLFGDRGPLGRGLDRGVRPCSAPRD